MYSWQRQYCKDPVTQDIVLIGGNFDGKVITVDSSHSTYVRMQIMNTSNDDGDNTEVYRIESILGRYIHYKVGVHENLSVDDALAMLIESYKQN